MQQDENHKVATANVSPSEDRARMCRYHDSLRHQRADAGQRIAEDSAARDNLQQKTMELTEELHEAENPVCVNSVKQEHHNWMALSHRTLGRRLFL